MHYLFRARGPKEQKWMFLVYFSSAYDVGFFFLMNSMGGGGGGGGEGGGRFKFLTVFVFHPILMQFIAK